MNLTFSEACSAVATLYEVEPSTYCQFWYWQDEHGKNADRDDPTVCSWCAEGGVALATGGDVWAIGRKLDRFTGNDDSSYKISDRGIEHAIRLLRLAAGEVE